MPSLKEMLKSLVNNLPDDCDWRLFHYRLYVARRLEHSLREIEGGRTYTTDEVRQKLADHARDLQENPHKRHVFVQSRRQLIDFLFHVQDQICEADGHTDLRISTADYLEAIKAWLDTCEGHYQAVGAPIDPDEPSWQLFADSLREAIRFR